MPSSMTGAGLEACLAFGAASVAVTEAREGLEGDVLDGQARAALDELLAAHDHLRTVFAAGATEGVAERALSAMVLAERATTLLG